MSKRIGSFNNITVACARLIDTGIPWRKHEIRLLRLTFDGRCEIDGAIGASQWDSIDRVLRVWCDQTSRWKPCAIGRDADKPPSSLCTSDSRAFICRRTKMSVGEASTHSTPNKQRTLSSIDMVRSICSVDRTQRSTWVDRVTVKLNETGSKQFYCGDF